MSALRVLVADDHELLRVGLVALLTATDGLEVVATAATGPEALDSARRTLPDVALLDVRMPGLDGIEVTRLLRADEATRAVAVVILTTFDDDRTLFSALEAGATGFVLKDAVTEELVRAVRVAHEGHSLLSPALTTRVIARALSRAQHAASDPPGSPGRPALTAREIEVLNLVAAGLSNEDIARRLHIEVTTVKSHVSRLLGKIGGRNRVDLVIAALTGRL